MWQELRDYLAEQVEFDDEAADGADVDGNEVAAERQRALVESGRATLAKMRELEAGR
jgi:hypothetical protein